MLLFYKSLESFNPAFLIAANKSLDPSFYNKKKLFAIKADVGIRATETGKSVLHDMPDLLPDKSGFEEMFRGEQHSPVLCRGRHL